MSEAPRPSEEMPSIYGPDGRPRFFNDPAMDRFVPVVLNLACELWIQTEMVANLVALVERKGLATREELDQLAVQNDKDTARDAALAGFVQRILAPLREQQA